MRFVKKIMRLPERALSLRFEKNIFTVNRLLFAAFILIKRLLTHGVLYSRDACFNTLFYV